MKIKFNNEFLMFLNSHSYSIYLLQRVIMITVYHYKYFHNNEFIRFIFIFASTLFISSIFDHYFRFIDTFFKQKKIF